MGPLPSSLSQEGWRALMRSFAPHCPACRTACFPSSCPPSRMQPLFKMAGKPSKKALPPQCCTPSFPHAEFPPWRTARRRAVRTSFHPSSPSLPHTALPSLIILMQLFKKLKKANNPDKIHAMVKEVTASLKEAKGWVFHHCAWGVGGHGALGDVCAWSGSRITLGGGMGAAWQTAIALKVII